MVISMDRWRGKVAVVTGASAGIGAAITERLVEEGMQVVGLARRLDRLEEMSVKLSDKDGKLYPVKADVTNSQDILDAFEWIRENLGPVHVLVNNAGIGLNNSLIDGDIEKWRKVLETNVLGLCVATREALNSMRTNDVNGHVIHINSVGGHKILPIKNFSMYCPSKFAVSALTEVMRVELIHAGSKIKVTSISPGFVRTEFVEANDVIFEGVSKEDLEKIGQSAEDIAEHVVYVLSTPPHVQVCICTLKITRNPLDTRIDCTICRRDNLIATQISTLMDLDDIDFSHTKLEEEITNLARYLYSNNIPNSCISDFTAIKLLQ